MDGLSGAASIIAVVEISAKVVSLCVQYSVAVKDARRDIERLQRKVTDIKNVLEKVRNLLDKQDKSQLHTARELADPLKDCREQLQELETQLEPGRGRTAMRRVGIRALKWPFTSKQVEKMVVSLEQYGHTFSLALQIDQT
jgi:septal ring factor EnvC (AmiA/AmiB activator)